MSAENIDQQLTELFKSGNDVTFVDVFQLTAYGMVAGVIYPITEGLFLKYYRILLLICAYSFFFISLIITIYMDFITDRGFEDIIRQVALLVMVSAVYLKYVTFLKYPEVIRDIINYINEDYKWMKHAGSKHQEAMITYIKLARTAEIFWIWLLIFAGLSFPITSVSKMILSGLFDDTFQREMAYEFYIIFLDTYKYTSPLYEIIYVLTIFIDIVFISVYLGYDMFTVVAQTHVCALLDCLKLDAMELFHSKAPFDRTACMRRLVILIRKQQRVYRLSEFILVITNTVYLVDLFLDSLEITFVGYQIITSIETGVVPYEFIMFFVAALVHIVMPCYFCDLITEKSLEFREAVYFSGWEENLDKALCHDLLFVMMRATVPVTIATKLGAVNMVMFTSVIRKSSSIFTLMRSTQE